MNRPPPKRPPTDHDVVPQAGELLARLPRFSPGKSPEELRVSLEAYNGNPYLRLSIWGRFPDGGWMPLKGKQTTIRRAELSDTIRALIRAERLIDGDDDDDRDEPPPRRAKATRPEPERGRAGARAQKALPAPPKPVEPAYRPNPGFSELGDDDA